MTPGEVAAGLWTCSTSSRPPRAPRAAATQAGDLADHPYRLFFLNLAIFHMRKTSEELLDKSIYGQLVTRSQQLRQHVLRLGCDRGFLTQTSEDAA